MHIGTHCMYCNSCRINYTLYNDVIIITMVTCKQCVQLLVSGYNAV